MIVTKSIRGFKVFGPDWACGGFQYEVGEVYDDNVTPSVYNRGFDLCLEARDCLEYYKFNRNDKVAEVVALGETVEEGDNYIRTRKIQIVREVTWQEVLTLVNTRETKTMGSSDINVDTKTKTFQIPAPASVMSSLVLFQNQ